MSPIPSCPGKIVTPGVETNSKIIQGLFKTLEERNKMFQKLGETWVLKKPESIYLLIAQQNIDKNRITKPATSNICSKKKIFKRLDCCLKKLSVRNRRFSM